VDPTVAAAVVAETEEHLGGQEVDLTVMFVDIRGFTSFAERAAPRAVVNRLNNFFEIVIPAIVRHGGQANKFTGDGLLALFGAPEQLPNHADKALDAALDIVTLLRTRFAGQLEVGIGINSGPAVAGTIGGGGKSDFTVIGDTVNTAERVERATRQTGDPILLAGSTHSRLTRDHGGFDERPSVPMQGKQHQVRLWTPRILDALSGLTAGNLGNVAAAAAGPLIGDELGDGVTVERFESD
jgi:class 3 adenylate cyclase